VAVDVTSRITREVTVRLEPAERFDADAEGTTVRVTSLTAIATTYPDRPSASEPYVYVTGRGLQLLASGSVGSRERRVHSLPYASLPEPIREAVAEALGLVGA
jgi:hypothetical protein